MKIPRSISVSKELIVWSKNELPKYQLSFSAFVERCYLMFCKNKEFKDLLLKQFYEENSIGRTEK